jgi:hypothetical protein
MGRPRPFSFQPADGRGMTVDDLTEFLAEAQVRGIPGNAYVRTMGSLSGFDMTNGPLCSRLTVVPGEVSS